MTSEEFKTTVKLFVEQADGNRKLLAREFEVAMSTVDRWWRGTANPHTNVQNAVIQWIKAYGLR